MKNPLPYEVRKHMVLEVYPEAQVEEIIDHPLSPTYWSRDLDTLVTNLCGGDTAHVVLYGGRDSFLNVYSGTLMRHVIPASLPHISGTEIRSRVTMPTTTDGREALIWATQTRYPIPYGTADLAIVRRNAEFLLIKKKRHEGLCSFMGGFGDVGESDEETAMRERTEEILGIVITKPTYVGSKPIEDPRYRDTPDGITTRFFRANYLNGDPVGGDDADAIEWVHRHDLIERLVPWHRPLAAMLLGS